MRFLTLTQKRRTILQVYKHGKGGKGVSSGYLLCWDFWTGVVFVEILSLCHYNSWVSQLHADIIILRLPKRSARIKIQKARQTMITKFQKPSAQTMMTVFHIIRMFLSRFVKLFRAVKCLRFSLWCAVHNANVKSLKTLEHYKRKY